MKVKDVMRRQVITVPPTETVFAAATKMGQKEVCALIIAEKDYCKESCNNKKESC